MTIILYKNANDIPKKYYNSLIKREIECWGSEPFSEYLICSKCMGIYSIEEVHGNLENYRKKDKEKVKFKCECGGETNPIYTEKDFLELFINYIKGEVSSVLLVEKNEVEGFGFLSKTNIGELIKNEFNTRPNTYNKDNLLLILANIIGKKSIINEEIICMNHIYLAKKLRKGNNAYKISKNIFFNNKQYSGTPVLLETRYDSNFYPIGQSMGFKTIFNDKYGYIIQYLSDYKKILDFFKTHKSYRDKKEFKTMIKAKKYALNILKNNPNFSNRKFYK